MADQDENLPEGTDKIIDGAAETSTGDELVVAETGRGNAVMERVRTGRDKISGQAATLSSRRFLNRAGAAVTSPVQTSRKRPGLRSTVPAG